MKYSTISWIMASLLVAGLSAGCGEEEGDKDSGTNPTTTKAIELTYPSGGETLSVGQPVTIAWTVNDVNVSSVGVKLTLDGGRDGYTEIGINPSTGLLGSIDPTVATSMQWTPDASHISSQCMIKVYDYTDESVNDKSGAFTVSQ